MVDLSLHIQDISENSLHSQATNIKITIIDTSTYYQIIIEDNGCGMNEEKVNKLTDPFFTSRTTRKVGLGVPLFAQTCEQTGGYVHITSKVNHGTTVVGKMYKNHIDAIPLGDITETIYLLLLNDLGINIQFIYQHENREPFKLDLAEIKEILGDVAITEASIMKWLKDYITDGIK